MIDTRATAATAALLSALLAAACSTTPAGSSSPSAAGASAQPTPSGSAIASASASPSTQQSVAPSATATATATATIAPRTGTWSAPQPVGDVRCEEFVAALDEATGYHVVALCEDGLQHLSSPNGEEWTAELIPAPDEGRAVAPQIAIDDGWLYVGYTRVDFSADTCSPDPYEELGVEVRSRRLADGSWAEPTRLGSAGDGLQSFRVVDALIYATVASGEGGGATLVTNAEGPASRVEIADASGTSLRIGDDGLPRIAYTTGDAVRVGTVRGDELTSSVVAEGSGIDVIAPALVLAPGDVSSLVWTQTVTEGEGCGEETEEEGTWFATDQSGGWETTRISELTGWKSLTLDVARSEAHVLIGTGDELHHFVRDPEGTWSSSLLPGRGINPVIRVDPATNSLVAFALVDGQIRMLTQE